MTSFDPIPFPVYDVLTDFAPYTVAQRNALDGNFAKVNSYLGSRRDSVPYFTRNARQISAYLGYTWATYDFSAADWPPISFIVPECSGMFVYIGGEQYTGTNGGWAGLAGNLSGPGVTAAGDYVSTFTGRMNRYTTGGSARFHPRSSFVVGQQITLTPRWMVEVPGNYYYDLCEVGCVPVR